MDITVKGKQMDVGEALTSHVEDTLTDTVTKYFDRALDAAVVFSHATHGFFNADITVHASRGMTVQGKGEGADAYVAFDQAVERIAKQLRRYHRKLVNHHKAGEGELTSAQYAILAPHADEDVTEEAHPAIVAEMPHQIATLSVSEAVMRLDLADTPVMMFRNGGHGGLNVVYRRADGNVGWIDPQIAAEASGS